MTSIKKLVAAIDFSDDSRNAASRTFQLAAEHGAKLELLHVISESFLQAFDELCRPPVCEGIRLIENTARMLSDMSSKYARETGVVDAAVSVKTGLVFEEILSASEQADMLVLGVRGWNPVRDILIGTTAERLLSQSTRPVLAVRNPAAGAYKRVIVPVDLTPYSAIALRTAMLVAPEADISVVHAFDAPFENKLWLADVPEGQIDEYRSRVRQKALESIAGLLREVNGDGRAIFPYVEKGDAASVILAKEAALGADLIVIGKHKRSYLGELLLGSVTRHILSGSKCDTLVVHYASV